MSHCSPIHSAKKSIDRNFNHRLNLYSTAAVAAGVSMLALAQPAIGEVIVTKKTIQIDDGPVYVDLNKDGISDFEFSFATSRDPLFHAKLTAKALTGGEVVGDHIHGLAGPYASALCTEPRLGLRRILPVRTARSRSSERSRVFLLDQWLQRTLVLRRLQSLPRREISDQRRNALWLGSNDRKRTRVHYRHDHRLCIRDYREQARLGGRVIRQCR